MGSEPTKHYQDGWDDASHGRCPLPPPSYRHTSCGMVENPAHAEYMRGYNDQETIPCGGCGAREPSSRWRDISEDGTARSYLCDGCYEEHRAKVFKEFYQRVENQGDLEFYQAFKRFFQEED